MMWLKVSLTKTRKENWKKQESKRLREVACIHALSMDYNEAQAWTTTRTHHEYKIVESSNLSLYRPQVVRN